MRKQYRHSVGAYRLARSFETPREEEINVPALRRMTDVGFNLFRSYLADLRSGSTEGIPQVLLGDESYSHEVEPLIEVEKHRFLTKAEAAEYLYLRIRSLHAGVFHDAGIWTWLSAFYFDSVCPPAKDGKRNPGADYRHLLTLGRDWRHSYRHLLAGPARTFAFHQYEGKLLLSGPINRLGDFVEQLSSRQEIASNRGVIEAATILFWDAASQRPKRGAAPTERKPGSLRRFIDVVQQLELTYDLYSMKGDEIVSLLPSEFGLKG
jgi:hypothetical protein